MNKSPKYYLQDEEVDYTEFTKALEVLNDYRITYSLTEECSNGKIFCNLYVCKDTIIDITRVIRELENKIPLNGIILSK